MRQIHQLYGPGRNRTYTCVTLIATEVADRRKRNECVLRVAMPANRLRANYHNSQFHGTSLDVENFSEWLMHPSIEWKSYTCRNSNREQPRINSTTIGPPAGINCSRFSTVRIPSKKFSTSSEVP